MEKLAVCFNLTPLKEDNSCISLSIYIPKCLDSLKFRELESKQHYSLKSAASVSNPFTEAASQIHDEQYTVADKLVECIREWNLAVAG